MVEHSIPLDILDDLSRLVYKNIQLLINTNKIITQFFFFDFHYHLLIFQPIYY